MSAMNPAADARPEREQIIFWAVLVLAAVFALGIALYVLLVLMPDLRLRATLSEELAVARVDLALAQRTQANAPDRARSQLDSARARLEAAAAPFLSEAQVTASLNRIYTYSRAAGVEVVSLQTQPAQATNVYTRKSFDFRLTGSLEGHLTFLALLQEVSLSGFVVDNVQIVPAPEGDEQTGGQTAGHIATMTVHVFTSPYAQSQAQAPAPGGPAAAAATLSELYLQVEEAWADNNWARAITLLNQIRAIMPEDTRAREDLYRTYVNDGYHLLASGDVEAAARQFNAALSVKPDGQEALAELRQLAANPSLAQSVARGLEAELQLAWNEGDWPEAIRLLRQLQLLDPNGQDIHQRLYEAYLGYGDQLTAEGKGEAAQEIYRRADTLRQAQNLPGSSPSSPITTTVPPGGPSQPTQIGTPTLTPTPTATLTPTPSPSPSPSPTLSPSPSPSATPSATPSPSPTPTASPSPSPSPTASNTPTPTGSATPTPTATGSISPTPTTPTGNIVYIVQPGDTLFSISQRYGITVAALKAANNLHSNTIYVGQALIIPPVSVVTPVAPLIYVVRPGDTLFSIARHYGTSVDAITRANGLPSSRIFVGQQLRIPAA